MVDKNAPRSVYAIRCKANGKMYIGSSVNPVRRFQQHFMPSNLSYYGINPELQERKKMLEKDFKAYGVEGFEIYIIEKGLTLEVALEREEFYTELYKTNEMEFGYNYKAGARMSKREVAVLDGLPPKKD